VASFNAIDVESQGYLEKSNFMYTITSFINKLLSSDDMHSKKTQNDWSQQRSQVTEAFGGSPKKFVEKAMDLINVNQSSKMSHFQEGVATVPQGERAGCASRIQNEFGVSLDRVY
jgi:hypothetical protein